MAGEEQPFRFMALPGEIRNKVYKEVLCSFENNQWSKTNQLARILRQEPKPNGVNHLSHSIETNILRTCKQIHREAYDVMVKTNCFIRITANNLSLSELLVRKQIPVVTMDRQHVAQFKGYVLHVVFAQGDDMTGPMFDLMILCHDWEVFCQALRICEIPTRSVDSWHIRLTINPCLADDQTDHKASLVDFFTTKIQETLLHPFRAHARGICAVKINGSVSSDLSQAVIEEVAMTPWSDLSAWLSSFEKTQHEAEHLQTQNKTVQASALWHEIIEKLCMTHLEATQESSALHERRARLLFRSYMQNALCYLEHLKTPPVSGLIPCSFAELVGCILDHLSHAMGFVSEQPHAAAATWQPGGSDVLKIHLAYCVTWRLRGSRFPTSTNMVSGVGALLRRAHLIHPDDEEVVFELEQWGKWADKVYTENAAGAAR